MFRETGEQRIEVDVHLSNRIMAGSFADRNQKNDVRAILAFPNRFPNDSRKGEHLAVVVGFVKDHVSQFAFVHKFTAFYALIEVFFFCVGELIKISRVHR
jgi:hypothetical protein